MYVINSVKTRIEKSLYLSKKQSGFPSCLCNSVFLCFKNNQIEYRLVYHCHYNNYIMYQLTAKGYQNEKDFPKIFSTMTLLVTFKLYTKLAAANKTPKNLLQKGDLQ